MATPNLAAASLGAAAPVPPAQDAPSKTAPGFADVLAGVTDSGIPADATGAGATRHAHAAKGQPAWFALERLARQLALSSGLPISGAGDPKPARLSAQDSAGEPVAPKADAEGLPPSALFSTEVPAPPIVPPTPLAGIEGLTDAPPIGEPTETATIDLLGPEAERAVSELVAPGSTAAISAANDRPRADAAVSEDLSASPETAVVQTEGLALEASEAPPPVKAPAPSRRIPRADVETFREWAATAARAQSPGTDGTPTPRAAAPAQQNPVSIGTVSVQAIDPGEASNADPASATGERGPRGMRRTTEAARAFVDRFTANGAPIEATPASVRLGGRAADAVSAPSGDKPRVEAGPLPRVGLLAPFAATPGPRTAVPIGSEAPALVDQEGGLESQIVQAVKVQWGRDGGEARIRLQPHYLGELMISLRVEQGGVTAHLVASAPEVRQWIEANEAVLRQSLAQHDLSLERLVVTEDEPSAGMSDEDPRHQDPRGQGRRQTRRTDRDATFDVVV